MNERTVYLRWWGAVFWILFLASGVQAQKVIRGTVTDSRLNELKMIYSPQYKGGWISEIGLSLNNLFGMFSIDVTRRFDAPGYYVGISVARAF